MRKPAIAITVFAAACILVLVSCYFILFPNNETVPAFEEGGLNLVIEDEVVISKEQPKIKDGEAIIPLSIIKKYFDPNIYWDGKLGKVTITTKSRVVRMKTKSLTAFVNNKPMNLQMPVTVNKGIVYIPLKPLENLYGITGKYIKTTNAIIIDYNRKVKQVARPLSDGAVVRRGRSTRYPIIKSFDGDAESLKKTVMDVFEEYDRWYKVRTDEGAVGYIEKEYVAVRTLPEKTAADSSGKENDVWKPKTGKINMVWQMMYNGAPDLSPIDKIEGLDVISPTWFQLSDAKGNIVNRSDAAYVEWAHKKGYKVWALFSNAFDSSLTEKFLDNTDARDNAIRKILTYASIYKLDGINIDFENIKNSDKQSLTQFVREITPLLREQGLVVSIDINTAWVYDRQALGEIVDYVMLMAYDQHWRTSPTAGSVAQVTWVEQNLKTVLNSVPSKKLVLGIPFYTRLWEEKKGEDGQISVSSKALTMKRAQEIIKEKKAKTVWDHESGQYYA